MAKDTTAKQIREMADADIRARIAELEGIDEKTARKAMALAAAKLPIRTRFVIRDQQLGS